GPGIGIHGETGLAIDRQREMALSQARSQAHDHLLGQVAEIEGPLIRVVAVSRDLLERSNQLGRAIEIGLELGRSVTARLQKLIQAGTSHFSSRYLAGEQRGPALQ